MTSRGMSPHQISRLIFGEIGAALLIALSLGSIIGLIDLSNSFIALNLNERLVHYTLILTGTSGFSVLGLFILTLLGVIIPILWIAFNTEKHLDVLR